jgi:hypothetical protein
MLNASKDTGLEGSAKNIRLCASIVRFSGLRQTSMVRGQKV